MESVESEDPRFGGLDRLYGRGSVDVLRAAHVCVVGIGGVGTWTAEALARSGVGRITLIDLDDVCLTNTNRQAHAITETIGRPKVDAMADRVRAINPECAVHAVPAFFTARTAEQLLSPEVPFDVVVDAIDRPKNKALLIVACKARAIAVVTVGGAGGKQDPAAVARGDLASSVRDGLLRQVRWHLRREHGFPDKGPWGVAAVFSTERAVFPTASGEVCKVGGKAKASLRIDCDTGYGSASFVTGTFGFAAASSVVELILRGAVVSPATRTRFP